MDEGADQHRTEDADGQVALRILRFFSRCRDRVEAVKGEKHDGGRRHHAALLAAAFDRPKAIGHEGLQIVEIERSEEHTSELQSLMRISYAVFCLKKKTKKNNPIATNISQR